MRHFVTKCVEEIKTAMLSHTPIIWIVVREKEIADDIAHELMLQHFGGRAEFGNAYHFKPIGSLDNSTLSALREPSIYFDWIDITNLGDSNHPNLELNKSLSGFLNYFLNIEFSEDSRTCIENHEGKPFWDKNVVIIASPELPDMGWINTYIETIYVSSLTDAEIYDVVNSFSKQNALNLPSNFVDQLIVNFRGISERQISNVLTKCLVKELFDSILWDEKEQEAILKNQEAVLKEIRILKRQMMDGFKGLKWIPIKDDDPQAAGLNAITAWLKERQPIFSDTVKGVLQGFDIPKGILITGIPGTGKSLMAKQTARILKLPLVAMDLGDLQEGIVGKSEEHMAAALRKVDALAPCVLWIDEIEKAFSGAESGSSDGGVMRRMFGKFLTWMQEKTSYCFVLATANDITKLPPELFRSQRFDEKYFTFMPSAKECVQMFIANIHLQNERIKSNTGMKINIFDSDVFENEDYWLNFLNNTCTYNIDSEDNLIPEEVQLDKNGRWLSGYLPQKKLFTGADISAFVNALKFKILSERKKESSFNFDFTGPIKKIEVDTYIVSVLKNFVPYGQSNLKDVALCFRSLTKNRFKSASSVSDDDAIIRFSDYDEISEAIKFNPTRFNSSTSKYDRTLYMCIVGAINNLPKENQQNQQHPVTQTTQYIDKPDRSTMRQPRNISYRENK